MKVNYFIVALFALLVSMNLCIQVESSRKQEDKDEASKEKLIIKEENLIDENATNKEEKPVENATKKEEKPVEKKNVSKKKQLETETPDVATQTAVEGENTDKKEPKTENKKEDKKEPKKEEKKEEEIQTPAAKKEKRKSFLKK